MQHTSKLHHKIIISIIFNKAIRISRLRTQCRHLVNSTKHNVIIDSVPLAPLCEIMMSFTNLEVHNVLHYCQRRTEPRPQVTWTENIVKFGHVVCEKVRFEPMFKDSSCSRKFNRFYMLYVTTAIWNSKFKCYNKETHIKHNGRETAYHTKTI